MERGWRKKMKRQARSVLRRHYAMFVVVCLAAGFLGTEFSGLLTVWRTALPGEGTKPPQEAQSGWAIEVQIPGSQMITRAVFDTLYENDLETASDGDRPGNDEAQKTAGTDRIQTEAGAQEAEAQKENRILGRKRGVFAAIVNSVTSGTLLVAAASALNSFFGSADLTLAWMILCAMVLYFLLWVFVTNMYIVISRRIFLEGRCYQKIPMERFLFLLKIRRWKKVSVTMLIVSVIRLLWDLTIVGGVIKRYSYYLVPFIVAENPNISAREAMALSGRMMNGHKWECFLFELSFIGWDLLSAATLRLSGVFFSYPYQVAAFGEYYAGLREAAIEKKLQGSEKLSDRYLFERATQEILDIAYGDVIDLMEEELQLPGRTGLLGKLTSIFGIVFVRTKEEETYEEWQDEHMKILLLKDAAKGQCYPARLSMMPEEEKRMWVDKMRYLRSYYVWNLVLMFFVFAFGGWVWEVMLHLITDGTLVNRGVLHGPWLPIYGAGSVLILILLNRLREKPLAEFAAAIVLCGAVEYMTGYVLEMTHNGQKWWDYSGYFLNLHGRICAEGLLVFGIGGVAIVYILAPLLDNLFRRIPAKILVPLCITLLLLFGADQIYSSRHPNTGKGITRCAAEEMQMVRKV
ncbi:DUF975 family protein [Parablautia sp. Marseille-Q6255]|uniref:DUF975 family protein n=1 Tax=Parablautia sp. Marseille-Q6255 TaxID=3039593 RepID=UPI0024BCD607|nr:DUF975 family protein [Parablautia sp. Marseille-Q6255]